MRYVVIGGAGFVGQELIRQLKEKKTETVVLDIERPNFECTYFQQDITQPLAFTFLPDDIVIHLAANQYHHKVPRRNREDFFTRTNTSGTRNIIKKMRQDGADKMIFFSTDMVYGKPQFLPVTTDHPCQPFGFYGKSKKEAEEICNEFRQNGFQITIFRPRMIIGKGRLGILEKLFKLIEWNLPVPTIGSGKNCYQMVSVADCAAAAILAAEKGVPNANYNLGSENPPTVRQLLKNLIRQAKSHSMVVPTWGTGVKSVLALLGTAGLELMYKEQYMIADENYVIDISKTRQELGWQPQDSDEDMIVAAFREYQAQKAR